MATNWITLTGDNLGEVLNWDIITKANQNSSREDQPADGQVDWDADNRAAKAVATAVSEVRAAIRASQRSPLSLTEGSVPPEAHAHVLHLAAWRILNTTPNLNMAILTEKGVSTPYGQFYKDALEYLKETRLGLGITPPTDPTGQDYLTEISDVNPGICGVQWSDMNMTKEEYDADPTIAVQWDMRTN